MLEILKFEFAYWIKRPETYLYFTIVFISSLFSVDLIYEGSLNPVKENAPHVISFCMIVISALLMLITSMILGMAALRDFDHQMESIMFINPITKMEYLLGRFLGSFLILVLIFSGVLWGLMLNPYLPWHDPNNLLPFQLFPYIQPFLFFVVPSLFSCGAIFFVNAVLSRKLLMVYTQGVLFFIIFSIATIFIKNGGRDVYAGLSDPFAFHTIKMITGLWTTAEQNVNIISLEGILLYNRLIWSCLGIAVLAIGIFRFRFVAINDTKWSKHKSTVNSYLTDGYNAEIPNQNTRTNKLVYRINQFWQHSLFHCRVILKETSFWAIVICAIAIIIINSISLGTYHGVDSYPKTYLIVEELQEMSIFFFLVILVFYSGELLWIERNIKFDELSDGLPIGNTMLIGAKFFALLFIYCLLIFVLIVAGLIFQTVSGYYEYNLKVYLVGFFGEVFPFLALYTFVAFFFQVVINHKFLAQIAVLTFFICSVIMAKSGIVHGLFIFGGTDLEAYSDMNGFGHFFESFIWFKLHWFAFSLLLFLIANLLLVRGKESKLSLRWKLAKSKINSSHIFFGAAVLIVFTYCGVYIFSNTNIINEYITEADEENFKAEYEKRLKIYESLAQPEIVNVMLDLDLYPHEREYYLRGKYTLVNETEDLIEELHLQVMPHDQIMVSEITIDREVDLIEDHLFYGFYVYELSNPLLPGDSVVLCFDQEFQTNGFRYNDSNFSMVYNGTFISGDHFPTIGYNREIELRDPLVRTEYGLKFRERTPGIENPDELQKGGVGVEGHSIDFEIIIGTDSSQTAIAPGKLMEEWIDNSRRYFRYKMDEVMPNFYSIVSAKYGVFADTWIPGQNDQANPVNLEIFYHKGHEYNLNRMMEGMKLSLDYNTQHFGPYQYDQLRIMEFPRYREFAQSFPNTIPFSESIGFILDINDEEYVDMSMFVTAHEVAHQWWGLQVIPANVQGKSMITETLAQYSALMVLMQKYPHHIIQKFLTSEMEQYFQGRSLEKIREMPLSLVESKQRYIRYNKGLLNMHSLRDYISEDSINIALKRFVKEWKNVDLSEKKRYATTTDLLYQFRKVTPDSMQYVITDLFETVTFYDNKIKEAYYDIVGEQFQLNLTLDIVKYQIDSTGYESKVELRDWVDLGVYTNNQSGAEELIYLKKHLITKNGTEVNIRLDQKPVKVVLDPNQLMLDKSQENDVIKVSFKPKNKYIHFIVESASY